MKLKRTMTCLLASAIAVPTMANAVSADTSFDETVINLSDTGVTVDGQRASTNSSSAVYVGADIVYYEEGHDSTYGEGTAAEGHSSAEAEGHTIVTITEPGTYRVSGKLSAGQLAVDLGEDAASDPDAKVTLVLDGVDITSTVAPGVIFYNVYEPYSSTEDTLGNVDLTNAGAQVILADNSVNKVSGSHVARIYKEGTTKKLHKYDGAFYSKMSMTISGESAGNGELDITSDNEGLNSELHLAINGGRVNIEAQDDGINTNEDGISVTSINGGYVHVNAGLGSEGDGIDSNGYLTINGGTVVAMSNERSPDGGIDADKAITINGGTVIGLGTRNDASSSDSKQPFMELSFAATQAAGSVIELKDKESNELLKHTAEKAFQSVTFSSSELAVGEEYHLYMNGVEQQYTGNSFGMMGGGFPGGQLPNGEPPTGGMQGAGRPEVDRPATGTEGVTAPPAGTGGTGTFPGGNSAGQQATNTESGTGSTAFIITESTHSFSGISEASDMSGKTRVTFSVNNGSGMKNVASQEAAILQQVTASADVPASDIQLTVTDVPSENYAKSGLLSELQGSLADIMPAEDGVYRLTVAVVSSNETYTGASEWYFTIGGLPFSDVNPADELYTSVKKLYEKGVMLGTSSSTFSPDSPVTRSAAITTLGRLLGVQEQASSRFTDVKSGSWYAGYVGWASTSGIVQGDGNNHFLPDSNLTAAQMKLILTRYAALSSSTYQSGVLDSGDSSRVLTRGELAIILAGLQ